MKAAIKREQCQIVFEHCRAGAVSMNRRQTERNDASINRRTKQEQSQACLGYALQGGGKAWLNCRGAKEENEVKSRLRFTRRGKPAVVNELTTSREESGARSDYPEARRKKTIVNRRTSEYNAKLFGFAELGRDSTMSESKL